MTALAPTVESFFTGYLTGQRGASPHTIASYRDTLRLLFGYVYEQAGIRPSALDLRRPRRRDGHRFPRGAGAARHNTAQTRNLRLAAIHSLFRYAALRHPEHAWSIARVLAIRPTTATRPSSPPDRRRGRGAAGQPRPRHLVRSPRPPADAGHGHQRAAGLRGHRRSPGPTSRPPGRSPTWSGTARAGRNGSRCSTRPPLRRCGCGSARTPGLSALSVFTARGTHGR